jgi:serine/threonine protein kinase
MGSVWRAWDERLHRIVALKWVHPRPELDGAETGQVRERALREARITARLHHAHTVQVYDVADADGQACLVMQYLPARNLAELISEQRALPEDEVGRIGAEIGCALAAAHRAGIVHCDVKPDNVLIDDAHSAKITDFGIAQAVGDATLSAAGTVTGTPAYLAPEVARGAGSTPASDVFSLGATLYAALEGQPPFGTGDNPIATLHRVASGLIDPPRRSGQLTPLLVRMLAPLPVARPRMPDVAWHLEGLLPQLRNEAASCVTSAAVPRGGIGCELDRAGRLQQSTLTLAPVSEGLG